MTVEEFKKHILVDITDDMVDKFHEFSRKLDLINPNLSPESQPELSYELGEDGEALFESFRPISGISWQSVLGSSSDLMIRHFHNIELVVAIRGEIKNGKLNDDIIRKILIR